MYHAKALVTTTTTTATATLTRRVGGNALHVEVYDPEDGVPIDAMTVPGGICLGQSTFAGDWRMTRRLRGIFIGCCNWSRDSAKGNQV
jgi:hypothetical protein